MAVSCRFPVAVTCQLVRTRQLPAKGWLLVACVIIAAIPVTLLLTLRSGPDQPAGRLTATPALVGSVHLDNAHPAPGTPVIATITIRADRTLPVDAMRLAVRDAKGSAADPAGRTYDFPPIGRIALGPQPQTITVAHEFPDSGTYVYYLQYRRAGKWQTLPPYNTFTVG